MAQKPFRATHGVPGTPPERGPGPPGCDDTSTSNISFCILPSCKRGRREPPKLPASRANRRAGLCAAVVHHHIPPSWVRRPMSLRGEQPRRVLRGGGASSHPAILGKAPNVSPAGNSCVTYCAAVVHHHILPSWVKPQCLPAGNSRAWLCAAVIRPYC